MLSVSAPLGVSASLRDKPPWSTVSVSRPEPVSELEIAAEIASVSAPELVSVSEVLTAMLSVSVPVLVSEGVL
jgi:hypothetical protein